MPWMSAFGQALHSVLGEQSVNNLAVIPVLLALTDQERGFAMKKLAS